MVISCSRTRLSRVLSIFVQPPRLAVSALGVHADDQLAEVASFQHTDKGFGRLLQTVDDILAVADAAVGDAGSDLAQECRIVLFSQS